MNTQSRFALVRAIKSIVLSTTVLAVFALAGVTAATAATVTLNVVSARTEPQALGGAGVSQGDPITAYKYIINVDNTGTTTQRQLPSGAPPVACTPNDPNYPASCTWTSIAGVPGSSPIYTQGTEADFASGLANVPDGRYLISVLADGYRLDGKHFTVEGTTLKVDGVVVGSVTVALQPGPLPDAQIQAAVFEDISPANGAPDLPAEHGLAGFQGHILDYAGEVTTDVYGDPLCGNGICLSACYVVSGFDDIGTVPPVDAAGRCPVATNLVDHPGFPAGSVVEGKIKIPNLGPNRYTLSVTPPDGSNWIQTTTLEGNHDWDAWVMEGATGLDTEFVVAGEPFPAIIFGYVNPATPNLGGTGQIKGVVTGFKTYVPAKGGVIGGEPSLTGARPDKPIENPWIALSDLQNGDTVVWAGAGNANGAFTIPNVPPGNYTLTWWDEPQNYILNLMNITVAVGEAVDLGLLPLNGWWTFLDGYVFNDLNRNGVKDAGEPGLPGYTLTMRKRENSLMDRGSALTTTGPDGYYSFESAYPMTQWLVMEAYDDLHYTTGVTFQADNQDNPTTHKGAGVDVSVLPIIGLSGRIDWGKRPYAPLGGQAGIDPDNGGIVGTVSYDTTRNELDPQYAATEDWQPGISGLTMKLFAPMPAPSSCVPQPQAGATCDRTGRYALDTDGSILKGPLLNTYITESWQRPGNRPGNAGTDDECVARDVNNQPLEYTADQQVTNSAGDCLEGPLMGVQFGTYPTGQGTPDANFGAAVDGNYGFGDGCFGVGGFNESTGACDDGSDPTTLPGGRDYLVEVVIPNDVYGKPLYNVTREEDINIGNGDEFIPAVPPPSCAGPLHIVDTSGNPNYPGTSPYEGLAKPLCTTKLVELNNGKSVVPIFHLFTDVPIPGRMWGLLVDDLNFSSDPTSLMQGEKAGVPFAPVGVYDWTNRHITTVESDYNGLWDVLLPSTNRISCPTPSGVCANLYRFVGNDPGIPGRLNLNYKPQFRTISAEFESLPGLIVPADLAPTQVGMSVQLPGGQFTQVTCSVNDPAYAPITPELFAVSKPYVNVSGTFTIAGQGFGTAGQVTLNGTALPTTSWSDTAIAVTVPAGTTAGPQQLKITRTDNGQSTVNGLTFHVLVSPVAPFPAGAVLDNFNRSTTSTTQTLGGNWSGATSANFYRITPSTPASDQNQAQVRSSGGNLYWSAGSAFGNNQDAYFTFTKTIVSGSNRQGGVLLKVGTTGGGNVASYISATYNATTGSVDVATATTGGQVSNPVTRATFTAVTFAAGDTLGARALADGTVNVYKNGTQIGTTNVSAFITAATGRIGVRFSPGTSNFNAPNDARFDDFGGGNVAVSSGGYSPNLYEVGPGKPYAVIQSAIDAAAGSAGDDLVVVYPGTPDPNPRVNPRGAYYENLVVAAPVKLQGVGPGGIRQVTNTTVPGSIIDGSAFGGDTVLAEAWRVRVDALQAAPGWLGNQAISEGEVIFMVATSDTQYGAGFKAAVDGFSIRGGDQQGQANIITQGGAIFANAYVRNLQITNNEIVANSSSYGTVRIGTPDLPAPNTSQHNENLRIANNRIIQNSGTNLAGGIALFAGADNYEVASNDVCGNFSAEYGGGMSVYGLSPNGSIHGNRIYSNQSYDEGGGIMIAGQLPANPATLSPGSGPVDIYNNLVQANMANDDGGGIRFLQAGNFPMNVYNNIIVNNVSTHEGGGIGINDAPDVRVYNNTIMKNITTATAVTSNGSAAPAGLSTSANSTQLQATLPGGSPSFSDPLLFNNIFWDNRAGARGAGTVTGLGAAGDATPINYWDLGVADGTGLLSPTNSILQAGTGTILSGSNLFADPGVISAYDVAVTFNAWRNNPAFVDAIMITDNLPPNLVGNYHLAAGSPAINLGAASKLGVGAPAFDIDNQNRALTLPIDAGADELSGGGGVTQGTVTFTSAAFNNAATFGPQELSGSTLAFGTVPNGSYSDVTLTVGSTAVTFGTASVTGGFSSPAAYDTCSGNTVAAAGTCTIRINIADGNSVKTGILSVPSSNGNPNPATLNLTGR